MVHPSSFMNSSNSRTRLLQHRYPFDPSWNTGWSKRRSDQWPIEGTAGEGRYKEHRHHARFSTDRLRMVPARRLLALSPRDRLSFPLGATSHALALRPVRHRRAQVILLRLLRRCGWRRRSCSSDCRCRAGSSSLCGGFRLDAICLHSIFRHHMRRDALLCLRYGRQLGWCFCRVLALGARLHCQLGKQDGKGSRSYRDGHKRFELEHRLPLSAKSPRKRIRHTLLTSLQHAKG